MPAHAMHLQALPDYASLAEDLVNNAKRWREWAELPRPEDDPLPGDWKRMAEFDRLLVFKCASLKPSGW